MRWQHPGAGSCSPGRVPRGRRGDRPHRADRRLGAPRGVPPACERVARAASRDVRARCQRQPLGATSSRTRPVASRPDALAEAGARPGRLELEITESVAHGDARRRRRACARCKELGVELDLDDFGTGYSSLSYLHRFPIDTLKIDRSFVSRLARRTARARTIGPAFVRSIVALARSRRNGVIGAEGVETAEQVGPPARPSSCEIRSRGHYFSKAVDEEMAAALIAGPLPWEVGATFQNLPPPPRVRRR